MVVKATPRPLCRWKETRCSILGGWAGRRTSMDRCGKFRPHWDFFFVVLCTSSALFLCPDCPGCAFCPYCATHTTQTSMTLAGFEPATPASDRPQTLALNRSATGIGGIRSPNRPARSESLYRPSYRSPLFYMDC